MFCDYDYSNMNTAIRKKMWNQKELRAKISN